MTSEPVSREDLITWLEAQGWADCHQSSMEKYVVFDAEDVPYEGYIFISNAGWRFKGAYPRTIDSVKRPVRFYLVESHG